MRCLTEVLSQGFSGKRWLFELIFWGFFGVLVACGITGSSLGWYKNIAGLEEVVSFSGERKIAGVYRGIRGDEFIAHGTPTALQQFHHQPKFPLLNKNVGLSGRNYLTLHDNGAPVKSWSILCRPAVWGFFVFDLRRALSWYWLFPVFAGLWCLKLLLNKLFPEQEAINFCLACAAVFSPYAAGWSFWPVNNAYGLVLAAAAMLYAFESKKFPAAAALGIVAGWGAGVSMMSLYVPRIVPVGYLMLFTMVGYFLTKYKSGLLDCKKFFVAAICAVLVAAAAALSWYLAAHEAISALAESVYPGQRRLTGGTMEIFKMFVGFLAPATIYKTAYSNQSELQQIFAMFLPLAAGVLPVREKFRNCWVLFGCAAFVLLVYIYQYVGLGVLADLSFWSHCNPPRAGFALNLAQVMIFAAVWYVVRKDGGKGLQSFKSFSGITLFGLSMLLIVAAVLWTAPAELYLGLAEFLNIRILLVMALFMAGYYLVMCRMMIKDFRIFILLYAALNVGCAMLFNPLCIAPERIENRLMAKLDAKVFRYGGRVLFATGNDFLATAYSCCGGKVFNGYFQYQDREIFDLLYRDLPDSGNFWRMNHLDVEIAPAEAPLMEAQVCYNDRILLKFNGVKYDFGKLPCDIVCVPQNYGELLDRNLSLALLRATGEYRFYRIKRAAD